MSLVSIDCPNCKSPNAIEATVKHPDLEHVEFTEKCSECGYEVSIEDTGLLQAKAYDNVFGEMLDNIYERHKDRELGL